MRLSPHPIKVISSTETSPGRTAKTLKKAFANNKPNIRIGNQPVRIMSAPKSLFLGSQVVTALALADQK